MLKELNLGRELKEVESVNILGGGSGKKHKRIKLKLEFEYESSRDTIPADTTTVALCDSIR